MRLVDWNDRAGLGAMILGFGVMIVKNAAVRTGSVSRSREINPQLLENPCSLPAVIFSEPNSATRTVFVTVRVCDSAETHSIQFNLRMGASCRKSKLKRKSSTTSPCAMALPIRRTLTS
jgi:hypothetical protein